MPCQLFCLNIFNLFYMCFQHTHTHTHTHTQTSTLKHTEHAIACIVPSSPTHESRTVISYRMGVHKRTDAYMHTYIFKHIVQHDERARNPIISDLPPPTLQGKLKKKKR
uniref:Uncharacterized protein n=1 Tax=Ixodes ricinus TaxID=34613 RepID=A0A147BT10_IXORI